MTAHGHAVPVGICGMGGFARSAAASILLHGPKSTPPLRLAAVCDPQHASLPQEVGRMREAKVDVLDHFDDLLARDDIAGVWLPLPIDLHCSFTQQALAAGKAVLCEKPAAGCIDDVDVMIQARDQADLSVLIGFQDIYDPTTAQVKKMLCDGIIGEIHHASVHACWPRSSQYFTRSPWAGRLRHNDTWVLDSPANNALAHPIHLALLLLGQSFKQSAMPIAMEAELYRAAKIENYDTISARATLQGGANLLVLLTHACSQQVDPVIQIHGQLGTVECTASSYRIVKGQDQQILDRTHVNRQQHMVQAWARALTGKLGCDELVATLEMARQHALWVCAASQATTIKQIGDLDLDEIITEQGHQIRTIAKIENAFGACIAGNRMLHEIDACTFTQAPGRLSLQGYSHFAGQCIT